MRTLSLLLAGLTAFSLGGCIHAQVSPASRADWTPKDRELLANVRYAQASIPRAYQRHLVDYHREGAPPGSIVVEARRSTHTLFLHVLDVRDDAGVAKMRRQVDALEGRVERALAAVPRTQEVER